MQNAKTIPLPEDLTPEKAEELFVYITQIYELLDAVIISISHENLRNADLQYEITTPFIKKVTESTNILSKVYTEVIRKGRPLTSEVQAVFEQSFRNIFFAIKELTDLIEEKLLAEKSSV